MTLPVEYRVGDATLPVGDGAKIIVHVCNDIGGWGAGFVLAVSRRWPEPEDDYRRWYEQRAHDDFRLGAARLVPVEPDLWVANIIGQHGVDPGPDGPPIRYGALEEGLMTVSATAAAMNASVHMPRIGCGLAGGEWHVVEPIIERSLCAAGIAVVVYDLP